MLWNSYSFFVTYANIDDWSPKENAEPSKNLLDQWVLSELQMLINSVNGSMEKYDLMKATRAFTPFVDHLSNWYIRRSRKRFWKSEDDIDKENAYATLHHVLVELAKLMAPFTPFIAEEIYRNLTGEASVHLAEYPKVDESLIDETLNGEMGEARVVVSLGLQLRADSKVKVRQPLSELRIANCELRKELKEIIEEELNVKSVAVIIQDEDIASGLEDKGWRCIRRIENQAVCLNSEITPDLRLEGSAREIIRVIQEGRKKAGFNVEDRVTLGYEGMTEVFANAELKELIAHEVLATEISPGDLSGAEYSETVEINDEHFSFSLKRAK
jgi:isoleucyl-tRNA synthetase